MPRIIRQFVRHSLRTRLLVQGLEERATPATFTVSLTGDSGPGTLHEAILGANLTPGVDDIVFNSAVFANPQVIVLTNPLPDLTEGVNIKGTSAANCTIVRSGGALPFRIFNFNMAGVGNVTMSNVTIWNGIVSGQGAGIFMADDNLTLTNCVLKNNSASSSGGGIALASGSTGTLTVTSSTISGNSSGSRGGGIYFNTSGTLVMDSSTVSGNTAAGSNGGGGVYLFSNTATIRNSTISGNQSTISTGAGVQIQSSTNLVIQNSTIAFNIAQGNGGGIYRNNGSLSLESTIVAKNMSTAGIGNDIFGAVAFAKYDLIGEIDGSSGISTPTNKLGIQAIPLDPQLAPLAKNGGPTLTHLPANTSPAINNGSNPAALLLDQRGVPRSGGAIDIGALEKQHATLHVVDLLVDEDDGNISKGHFSLREAINLANASDADSITFDSTLFSTPKTITLTLGELVIRNQMDIFGPGAASLLTISGGNTSRVIRASVPANMSLYLNDLTISQGYTADSGGGILVQSAGTSLVLYDCRVVNNTCGTAGGGIAFMNNNGAGAIQFCTIAGNSAGNIAGLGGGGIFTDSVGLLISDSTISGNTAKYNSITPFAGSGGGLLCNGSVGATIVNSTISGNSAFNFGGGICLYGLFGSCSIRNSTITANSVYGFGGGIGTRNNPSSIPITLQSSILFGNQNSIEQDEFYCGGGGISATTSLIGSKYFFASGGKLTADAFTQGHIGVDPALSPLADNGGYTQTHAIAATSIAANNGSNPDSLVYDQRGMPRTAFGAIDIGSYENQAALRSTFIGGDALNPTSWQSALNWSNGIPGKYDVARLTGSAMVDLKAAAAIGGLEIPSTWTGKLSLFAPLTLNDKSSWDGGTISLQAGGAVTNLGTVTMSPPSLVTLGGIGTWSNQSAMIQAGAGNLAIANSALLETVQGALFELQSTGGLSGTGTFNNKGKFRKSTDTGTSTIASGFSNPGGTIDIKSGKLAMLSEFNLDQGYLKGVGTLVASVNNSIGSIRPGNSPGKLTINGNYTQSGTGDLRIEMNGNTVGVNYDQLAVVGAVSLGGTLTPSFGFFAKVNDTFLIIDNDGTSDPVTGTFNGLPEGTIFPVGGGSAQISYKGGDGNDVQLKVITAPTTTKITAVQVNDGSAQRSMVSSLKITFNQAPSLPDSPETAFQLRRNSDNAIVTLTADSVGNDVILTFTGGAVNGKSLADGRYTLTVYANLIANFDGDSNATPGDDYVLVGNTTNKLFRLFGDADGNGIVDGVDFGALRSAFNTTSSIFDFDGSGIVDGTDFGQFRQRFGIMV